LIESFNNEEKEFILKAFNLCKQKHKWQYRDEWTPYYSHPVFVAIKWIEFWLEAKDIIVLLLHDTIEDTDLSYEDIKKEFWEYVANTVKWLSKKDNWVDIVSKDEYYWNLSNNEKLAILKWLDRLANLFSLNFATPEKKEKYLKETREIILPIVAKYSQKLAEELQRLIDYIENDFFKLPPELWTKLNDLKEIVRIRWEINWN
jgi:(p)ppGpp synthase/HD superfamily hydrolase